MPFRQRLAFFVGGCMFVIVGQVVTGLVARSATAQSGLQDAEFGTIAARALTVSYPVGAMRLGADATSASTGAFSPDRSHAATLLCV